MTSRRASPFWRAGICFFWHTVPIPQFSTIYECTDGAAGLLKDLQKADAGASDR